MWQCEYLLMKTIHHNAVSTPLQSSMTWPHCVVHSEERRAQIESASGPGLRLPKALLNSYHN